MNENDARSLSDIVEELSENSINWDESLEGLQGDADTAKFDVITSRVQTVIENWMNTTVWAKTPEEFGEPLIVSVEKQDDTTMETKLGELASVQFLGVLARLCVKADVDIDPQIIFANKQMIMQAVGCLMVEGIMVANAPGWSDEMDKALGDVRESRWTQAFFSPHSEIVKQRDVSTDDEEKETDSE